MYVEAAQASRNNSEGKTSLKRQKSPETTMDTQDVSEFC